MSNDNVTRLPRSSFGAGNVVCLSASWRAWSAGHRVSLRMPFAATIRSRRRWSTGCGTCCLPDQEISSVRAANPLRDALLA